MRAVDLLLDSVDPESAQDPEQARAFDTKHLANVFARIAKNNPDNFAEIAKALTDAGRSHAYWSGATLTLDDMRPVVDREAVYADMDQELAEAQAVTPEGQWPQVRNQIWEKYLKRLGDETNANIFAKGSNLANTVLSGARGNPSQLRFMVTTPGLYTDYKDQIIPYFIRESYGDGVRPAALLAASFGARKSVIATKTATANAGDIGKQAMAAGSDLVVTEEDCGTDNGILLGKDDELKGGVLAQDVGDIPAGTMIDNKVYSKVKKAGPVKVRSVLTCQADHGVCSKCLGKVPTRSGWAPIGYSAGITAANSVGEPLAQSGLNTKHTAGAFGGGKREYSGIKFLTQFLQSPEAFEDRTALSELSGTVDKIEEAPQGGFFIDVRDDAGKETQRHYIPGTLKPTVKQGQSVERGEELSDGLADVEDIIRLRGLGEGRLYFARRLGKILGDSGIPTSRLNLEVLSRAMINHVRIAGNEEVAGFMPDEVVGYSDISRMIQPRQDARLLPVREAKGKYLQSPQLHYSIGTQLLPSMVDKLEAAGVSKVPVSDEPYEFEPIMVGLRRTNRRMKDWLARQASSYLSTSLQEDAAAGRDTNVLTSTHFAPPLAYGTDFAKNIGKTGEF